MGKQEQAGWEEEPWIVCVMELASPMPSTHLPDLSGVGPERRAFQLGDAKGRRQTEHRRDGLSCLWPDSKAVGTSRRPSGTPDLT